MTLVSTLRRSGTFSAIVRASFPIGVKNGEGPLRRGARKRSP